MERIILVVEDEPTIAQLYIDVFEDEGDQVEVVASAPEAIERLRSTSPDVVILDLRLAVGRGEEVVRAIPAPERPPLIVVSADMNAQRLGQEIGAPVLPKPFELGHLLATVDALTQRSH